MSRSRFGLLCRKVLTNHMRRCARWDQSSAANVAKVTLNQLSDHLEDQIMIKTISKSSFVLHNDNIRIIGPTVFFPREVLHWNVKGIEDINEASLSLFTLIDPKVDVLLIGVGNRMERLSQEALKYLRVNKINFDVLPTEKACALFNFLNGEQRQVAAAVIPPTVIDEDMRMPVDDDLITFDPCVDMFGQDPDVIIPDKDEDWRTPGEKLREAATGVRLMINKRRNAQKLMDMPAPDIPDMQDIVDRVMDEVEKEAAKERAQKEKEKAVQEKGTKIEDGEKMGERGLEKGDREKKEAKGSERGEWTGQSNTSEDKSGDNSKSARNTDNSEAKTDDPKS
ncbi:uncharacterized protein LOC133183880 [Saccostrea echinata]|uniref:uncharacterized protein LOC133183880 n=1 Tax=Saccostrea echinata TaxID=191078 RepID=UPI002A820AF2|nr:uncharacterized protein LOC133183880 [Saccostrea echinata]